MKILVPVDFSPDALTALRYASQLGTLLQTTLPEPDASSLELLLFHTFQVPIGGDARFFVNPSMLEREEQGVQHKIREAIGTIPELQTLPHRLITKLSMPQEGIMQLIDDEDIDLVVMGSQGANEASSDWWGSTTLYVLQHASCPVLAVPRTTQVFHPKQVGFATDLETLEETSLDLLQQLLRWWRATLHILHVHPHPSTIGVAQAEEALHLDHMFHGIPHTYHFPEDKNPARGIERYLRQHPVDLLVIIPRYHFALDSLFHKSVTKYLAAHTSIPLLAFHEKL